MIADYFKRPMLVSELSGKIGASNGTLKDRAAFRVNNDAPRQQRRYNTVRNHMHKIPATVMRAYTRNTSVSQEIQRFYD